MSGTDADSSEKHPWIAAALAVLVPGLGHAYARAWLRAALWLALFLASIQFLVPDEVLANALSVDAFSDIYTDVPDVALFLVAIVVMNVIDAYLTTSRMNQQSRPEESCPHCGKELDGDLEFCHWCTTRIDTPSPDDE